jgi:hypothetical protein
MTHIVPTSADTSTSSSAGPVRRFMTDALLGLGLFGLGMVMTTGPGALAATITLDPSTSGLLQQTSAAQPVVLLAAVFSLLFAFNAAFFRHLARAYTRTGRR